VGRAPACEVQLDYDPYLSGEHCSLERAGEGFAVRDAGSRNGTWVNWVQLPRRGAQVLKPGDVLGVGRSLLVLQG
jgi:predicted component of type VI protein secretion system